MNQFPSSVSESLDSFDVFDDSSSNYLSFDYFFDFAALDDCALNDCGLNSNMDDANMEVVLHPDYVKYQDNYYSESKLTFSHCHVQINDSTSCEKQGALNFELAIDDVLDIKSQLFPNIGIVVMKLCVISRNAGQTNHVTSTSGIEELKIVVVDSNWPLKQKQITSLNAKYATVWKNSLDMDVEGDGIFPCRPTSYFIDFQESFDELVYPKGDPDAVSISKRDVDLLRPETYINDTIIDFYIQYLKNKIQEKGKARFHFFNSFFFQKMADTDKNPPSACDGKSAFLRVRKWTRKVNLFEKDYIFIPVNFNLHWSLIVICHPGEVVNINDIEPDKSLRMPCILHMDSVKGYHSGLKDLVQSYLSEEWKEKKKDTCGEDLSSRFLNMRFLSVEVPQQRNSYDCGLFLLHYLELFLAEAPINFNPLRLPKFSNFVNLDWFPPAEAYLKRTFIHRLIYELVESQGSPEGCSSDNGDDEHCLEYNDNRIGDQCHATNGEASTSHSGRMDMAILSESTFLCPPSFSTSHMVLKEHFEPGASAGTSLGHCQSFDQQSSNHCFNGSVFIIEEDTNLSENLTNMTTVPNCQQVAGISPQSCLLPDSPRVCEKEISHRPKTSLLASLDTSSCASDDSDDIQIIENFPTKNESRSLLEDGHRETNCMSTQNLGHLSDMNDSTTIINLPEDNKIIDDDVQIIDNVDLNFWEEHTAKKRQRMPMPNINDSSVANINLPFDSNIDFPQHSNMICAGNNNGYHHFSYQETPNIQLHQVSGAVDNKVNHDDVQFIGNMNLNNIWEEYTAKKRRLMPLPDNNNSPATINLPFNSLIDFSQHSNMMSAGNKNEYQHLSYQGTPNIQLHQVSDAVNNTIIHDDVQMIDNTNLSCWEWQAAIKRQPMPMPGRSGGILSYFSFI